MKKFVFKNLYFVLLIVLCFMFYVLPALAQYKLETALPNVPSQLPAEQMLPNYIKYLFIFGLSIVGIVALGVMMAGGIQYILAAGNMAKTAEAKDRILQALIGVGFLLVSYLLLYTINPDLVNLKNPDLSGLLKVESVSIGDILGGKNITLEELKKAEEGAILYKSGKDILWKADNDTVINCETTIGGETECGSMKISDLEKTQKK